LSTCIKITYGNFDYFTGGDISGIDAFGGTDLSSVESHIAPVVGPVDVATLNHHGNRDSQNAYYVRTIRPRVWVQQNWSSDHPGEEVLRRITSETLYPGERDIFSTIMLQANKDVIGDRLNAYKSQQGHIVVRVYNGGAKYEVYILNDASEKREVLAKFGPYESR
jgi:beta-lactamase superfamily II metal-dependent hydrolase